MKRLILLLIVLFYADTISSQQVFFEIKSEFNRGRIKYNWPSKPDKSSLGKSSINFSIGANIELNKFFSLKTTVGTADFSNHIFLNWTSDKTTDLLGEIIELNSKHSFIGDITISQNFLEILPQINLLNKWLFVNMGFGVFSIRSNTFQGYYWRSKYYYKNKEIPKFLGRYKYLAVNIGLNQKIVNHLYVTVEIGYKFSQKTRMAIDYPGIGINQELAKIGFAYGFD